MIRKARMIAARGMDGVVVPVPGSVEVRQPPVDAYGHQVLGGMGHIPGVILGGVLLAAGHFVVRGELSIGGFFAFNLLLTMLVMPLRMLGMWIGQAQRATASGERFFEVIDEPEEVADEPSAGDLPPGPGRVVLQGVRFGYDRERPVLEEIDLVVGAGSNGLLAVAAARAGGRPRFDP